MEREDATRALRGIYILLVDDQPRHRELLRDILRYCGAWVHDVPDADAAQEVLREALPAVLVVRVRARSEDAWRLVRLLRAMRPEDGGKVPVIGVGASALEPEARAHGLDGYVSEPFEAMALCRVVAELID